MPLQQGRRSKRTPRAFLGGMAVPILLYLLLQTFWVNGGDRVGVTTTYPQRQPCRCMVPSAGNPDALGLTVLTPSAIPPEGEQVLVVRGSLDPEVSIIMAYNGRFRHTFDALKSVVETTPESIKYEVILVDDGSEEEKVGTNWLVDRVRGTGLKHLRSATNLLFTRANNAAFEHTACGARFVVLLNNDVIVKEGWLEALHNTFFAHRNVGYVGSKLIFFNHNNDAVVQEAGGIVWSQASAANYGRGLDPGRPEFNYVREVNYCSGAAVMLDMERICRRRASSDDHLFDKRYAPAYYEDTDLAMEVRHTLGLSVLYQPDAVVFHNEGSSLGTDVNDKTSIKHHQELNKVKFLDKWRTQLEAKHLSEACSLHISRDATAADRGNLRVLVIDHNIPAPDRDSGSLRIVNIMDLMMNKATIKDEQDDDECDRVTDKGIKCQITLVALNFRNREPYVHRLQQSGVEVLHEPYYKSLDDVHQTHLDFDIIFICRAIVFKLHYHEVKKLYPDAMVVFDTVDLTFLREARQAKIAGKEVDPANQEMELSFLRQADWSVVVSSFEYDLLVKQHKIPTSNLIQLSNVHEVEPSQPSFASRSGMIFIAHFHHAPNIDAISWYLKEIHPRVLRQVPDALFNIVGDGTEILPAWMANVTGVRVVGHLPDTKAIYAQVRMTVAPLRVGAGVKGKVSQSLARGVPVVGTSIAAEGMGLTDGEDMLIADNPDDFADKVVRLWRNEALWKKLRENGFKRVEALFSRRAAQQALRPILESAQARRPGREISRCISAL